MPPTSSAVSNDATADAVFKSACKERVLLAYINYNLDITKVS